MITESQSKSAIKELERINRKKYYSDSGYRYYIDWLHSLTPDEILNNKKDLIVISTLDLKIQKILDNAVQDNIKNMDKNSSRRRRDGLYWCCKGNVRRQKLARK